MSVIEALIGAEIVSFVLLIISLVYCWRNYLNPLIVEERRTHYEDRLNLSSKRDQLFSVKVQEQKRLYQQNSNLERLHEQFELWKQLAAARTAEDKAFLSKKYRCYQERSAHRRVVADWEKEQALAVKKAFKEVRESLYSDDDQHCPRGLVLPSSLKRRGD
jgi:hypothetical protein